MRLEFDYLKKRGQAFPVIDVELSNAGKIIKLKALVDSGASFSVFRPEVAEFLGIEIKNGQPVYLTGIGGRILGYTHKLAIKIGGRRFVCKIVFSKEFTVSFNILGRDNFFMPFLITFMEKQKKIVLETSTA